MTPSLANPSFRPSRPLSIALLTVAGLGLASRPVSAQIIELGEFNPSEVSGLCGLGYDVAQSIIWVYACSNASLHSYATDGSFLGSIPRPGESANDVDVEIAPEAFVLDTTALPAGTILFINGETGVAEIYALDPANGTVLATLVTAFGVSHVVGGAYHPFRDTIFLIQDNVPGPSDENRIAEIDPLTGNVIQSFQITSTFIVSFGDVDVSDSTGNLFVVSSLETGTAEYTPDGTFVQEHLLPAGVSSLSGLGSDCAVREAWVAGTGGEVWHLGEVPCLVGTPFCTANANSTGAPAEISASGTASSSNGDLAFLSTPVPNQPGIFFHGANQVQLPFGNGFMCTAGGVVRGAVVSGSANSASYTYDNSDGQHDLSAHIGSTRHFQHWFRDPMGGGAAFNTSNATSVSIAP